MPKGYLYAAIGFSILIELFNQLARRNRARGAHALSRRQRTAQAVLRLLRAGRAGQPTQQADEAAALVDGAGDEPAFAPEESSMIERVLAAGARDVRSIMVPRGRMVWLDVADSPQTVVRKFASGHSRLPLCAGDAATCWACCTSDVLPLLSNPGPIDLVELAREPLYVLETTPVLKVLDELRASRDHMLIVVDEHGVCEGLVTPMDVLTAVGGELPEHREDPREAVPLSDGSWLLEAVWRPTRRPGCWTWMQPGKCAGRDAGGLPAARRRPHPGRRGNDRLGRMDLRGDAPRRAAHRSAAGAPRHPQ